MEDLVNHMIPMITIIVGIIYITLATKDKKEDSDVRSEQGKN